MYDPTSMFQLFFSLVWLCVAEAGGDADFVGFLINLKKL